MELIKYNSIEQVKNAVNNGVLVNWENGLYSVKKDFDGDLVIRCNSTNGGELLTEKHLSKLFTQKL